MEIVDNAEIPVVDFGAYSLYKKHKPTDEELKQIVMGMEESLKVCNAFFIKNHGIDQELISHVIAGGRKFFSLPIEDKNKFYMDFNGESKVGYLNELSRAGENISKEFGRETLVYSPQIDASKENYKGIDPDWLEHLAAYFHKTEDIFVRLLECTSLLLGLERGYLYSKYLGKIKSGDNLSSMRFNEYPPVAQHSDGNNLRFGVHADYSLLTLLHFSEKGLLSELKNDRWLSVDPRPGLILVQAGFVMQNITKGRIPQNRHCVVTHKDVLGKYRYSVAYFGCPDYHTNLTPIPELEAVEGWENMEKISDTRSFGDLWKELIKLYMGDGPVDHEVTLK